MYFEPSSKKEWRRCAHNLNRAMNGHEAAAVLADRGLFLLAQVLVVKTNGTNQESLYGISRSQPRFTGEAVSNKA